MRGGSINKSKCGFEGKRKAARFAHYYQNADTTEDSKSQKRKLGFPVEETVKCGAKDGMENCTEKGKKGELKNWVFGAKRAVRTKT